MKEREKIQGKKNERNKKGEAKDINGWLWL